MLLADSCRRWQNSGKINAEIGGKSIADIKVRPTYSMSAGEIKFLLLEEPAVALHLALQDRDSFGD